MIYVAVEVGLFHVYVPGGYDTNSTWVEYTVKHEVNPAIREDVWRIYEAYECSRSGLVFTRLHTGLPIIEAGQWEVAILEQGAADYMGGLHGDEVKTAATLSIDGGADTLDVPTAAWANYVTFTESTDLYRVGVALVIATRAMTIRFNAAGVSISQTVTWTPATNVVNSYMAMLPIERFVGSEQLTSYECRDYSGYAPKDVSYTGFPPVVSYGAKVLRIWRPGGVWAQVCTSAWPVYPNRWEFVQNTVDYNKVYFDLTGAKAVAAGEVWNTTNTITVKTTGMRVGV